MIKRIIFMIIVFVFFAQISAFAQNIAVIVNKDSLLFADKPFVDIADVKDVYLGKVRFSGKALIKVINQNTKDIAAKFVSKVCGMDLDEYQNHWVKLEFFDTGMGAPKKLESYLEVIRFVQKNKFAVGYIWEEQAKNVEGVKIISVISE